MKNPLDLGIVFSPEEIQGLRDLAADADAKVTRDRIVTLIQEFEENIPDDEIAAMILASFSVPILDVGYSNPNLIIFYGKRPDGTPVHIIQHISQVSLCLSTVKRPNPSKQRRRIGFDTEESK